MILLIFCIIIIIALIANFLLKIPQKIMILSACVILLVLCNFINEIQAYNDQTKSPFLSTKNKQIIRHANRSMLPKLDHNSSEALGRQLLDQQRQMATYLMKKWSANQNMLAYFTELHKNRLKLILALFEYRQNLINPDKNTEIYHINYDQYSCDYSCLARNFAAKSSYTILIIQNIEKSLDLNQIERFYEANNITVIFQNIPKYFNMHSISRLTEIFRFSNNYLPKILEQHLPKVIQSCALYHSFDYHFYMNSLKMPLNQLCSKTLPSNPSIKCLKKLILDEKQKIPENWGRRCLQPKHNEGIIFQNGWLGLKKQSFWSGKLNKNETTTADQANLNL